MKEQYRVSAIAAIGENRELGRDNKLLWDLPTDMARFREKTRGHTVIMGSATAESIIASRGAGLPDRPNIVITRRQDYKPEGFIVAHSIEEALSKAREIEQGGETFIIGGGQIYTAALPFTERLYLTLVHKAFPDADAFFPDYYSQFKTIVNRQGPIIENGYTYEFVDLEKS